VQAAVASFLMFADLHAGSGGARSRSDFCGTEVRRAGMSDANSGAAFTGFLENRKPNMYHHRT
jgi:hypothetical protein